MLTSGGAGAPFVWTCGTATAMFRVLGAYPEKSGKGLSTAVAGWSAAGSRMSRAGTRKTINKTVAAAATNRTGKPRYAAPLPISAGAIICPSVIIRNVAPNPAAGRSWKT